MIDPACLVVDEPTFWLQWKSGQESLKVFDYNPLTRVFTATPFAAGRVAVAVGATSGTVTVGGDLAMTFNNAGLVTVAGLSEKTKVEAPRVEFYRKVGAVPQLLAMLSENWLGVKKVTELPSIPVTTDHFQFFTKACIGLQGLVCDGVTEV